VKLARPNPVFRIDRVLGISDKDVNAMERCILTACVLLLCLPLSAVAGLDEPAVKALDDLRHSETPPSPQRKPWLLIPHAGMKSEGCERQRLQNVETSFGDVQKLSAELRAEMLARQPVLTTQRQQRMRDERAQVIVSDLRRLVRDPQLLVALGKAFFWDQQVGSDGQTACASCHFRAGADARPISFGMPLRLAVALPGGGEFAGTGLEPSCELRADQILRVYENRWGGMVNFSGQLNVLAVQGLRKLTMAAQAGGPFPVQQVRERLQLLQLVDGAPEDVRVGWQGLLSAVSGAGVAEAGVGSAEGFAVEILTRLQLVLDALLYSGAVRTVDAAAAAEYAAVSFSPGTSVSELQGRWPGLSSDQLLGVTGLGRALAPQETQLQPELQQASVVKSACDQLLPATFQRRRELPRNAPSVINAVFSDRLFHDGRADSVFNGYDHLGDEAGPDGYGKWVVRDGRWCRVLVRLPDAALASQSTAPLLSASEMSWFGRQYHHVARKLLDRVPLSHQQVAETDSHLGRLVRDGRVIMTYRQLIKRVFCDEWWCGGQVPAVAERDALTGHALRLQQMEANFSLFWGVAVMAYQQQLVSDQSEFDDLMRLRRAGESVTAGKSSEQALRAKSILAGYRAFQDHACADCHRGPEFAGGTRATVFGPVLEFEDPLDPLNDAGLENQFLVFLGGGGAGRDERIERMLFWPDRAARFYDSGYYNIGVTSDRPASLQSGLSADQRLCVRFDPGVGGEVELDLRSESDALQSVAGTFGQGLPLPLLTRATGLPFSLARRRADRWSVVQGAFRTPGLRNIALTGPYFHAAFRGDKQSQKFANLHDVLEHYAAPYNELGRENADLHPALRADPETGVRETAIPTSQYADVVQFLEALTDPRVARREAPFDHPALQIPLTSAVTPEGQTATENLQQAKDF
jgi:cytochrome c peroxidase